MQATVRDYRRRTIYHSPQTPGFTSWVGLWTMPDRTVMLSFAQATGPLHGWRPKALAAIRHRLSWPPPGHEGYDMTGLILENVHLQSHDHGESWVKVSADPFQSPMNGCTGDAEQALADGTIIRAVWGHYLPYWDVPQSGYIQRSLDGAKSWGMPEPLSGDPELQTWPKRIRPLKDGRIVITGAAAPFKPDLWTRDGIYSSLRFCLWVSKDKEARSWSGPIYVIPNQSDCCGEEFDVAELENGDLLAIYRVLAAGGSERRQSLLLKKGPTWDPTPFTKAPFPHSGHPELLALRDGPILHLATNGTWATDDCGATWTKLDLPGTAYYPRSVQLEDGTIMVIGHIGTDDPYGSVDQSIVMDTYRINYDRS